MVMKLIFIDAKSSEKVKILDAEIKKVKGKAGLITTVQYLSQLKGIQKKIPGSVIGGQILGCNCDSAKKISSKVDSFLYIGTGRFHPLNVAYSTGKPVVLLDPYSGKLSEIPENEVGRFTKKKKNAYAAFISVGTIGIIVSTKPGQCRLKEALRLKKSLEKQMKKVYIFVDDTLDYGQLENYRFIDVFVNSACPRIIEDELPRPVVNIDDIGF